MGLGKKPELRWIDKRLLQVDRRYQREIETRGSQKLIARIAETFSWFGCGALVVAPAGKKFNILDGQHRHAAAMMRDDIKDLPCVLSDVHSLQEQALAFISLNRDRVALTPLSIFWSLVESGDQEARGIMSACREAGVEVLRSPVPQDRLKPKQTMALGELRRLYRGDFGGSPGGRKMMVDILSLIREAYPDKPGQLSSLMIFAVTKSLSNQVKRCVMLIALKETDKNELLSQAHALRSKDETLMLNDAFYRALWKIVLAAHSREVGESMLKAANG